MAVRPGRPLRDVARATFALVFYALLVAGDPYLHAVTVTSPHHEATCAVCAASNAPSEIDLAPTVAAPDTAAAGCVHTRVAVPADLLLGAPSTGRSPPA